MTVPLSLTFSGDFGNLRTLLLQRGGLLALSSYDNIPDRLFTGAKESNNTSKANQQRITVFILLPRKPGRRVLTTALMRWHAEERPRLFAELAYTDVTELATKDGFPKVGPPGLLEFYRRWHGLSDSLERHLDPNGPHQLVVPKTAGYYIAAYPSELDRTEQIVLRFATEAELDMATVLLNSGVFFWVWRVLGDSFHVTNGWVGGCRWFAPRDNGYREIAAALRAALQECTVYKGYRGVDVPNVNYNRRLDLVFRADEWIIRHVAPDMDLSPLDFAWGKSSSFLRLRIPKAAGVPAGFEHLASD